MSPSGLLALRRFTLATRVGGAGEHGIFRRDPTFTFATQPWRNAIFDAGGNQYAGVTKTDKAASFGMFGEMGFDRNGAHFVWRTA